MSGLFDTLRSYLRFGWRVLAVHPVRDGICACYKGRACDHPGKHPVFKGGCHSATTDEAILRAWYEANPDSNWGIATGTASGLLVLDIDPRNGGNISLDELVSKHGPLPKTLTVKTGGGGMQYYFRYPVGSGLTIGSSVHPGIDFRGDGGMVVVPPSLHLSGLRYEWDAPTDTPLIDAPPWLIEVLRSHKAKPSASPSPLRGEGGGLVLTVRGETPDLTGDGVAEGGRHNALCQRVGVHLNRGDSRATLEALVRAWAERCVPAMDEDEAEEVLDDLWDKHHAEDDDLDGGVASEVIDWPTLGGAALHGLAGEVVRTVGPFTEADPVALLLSFLTAFGNCVGRYPFVVADGTPHYPNLFAVLVGASSKARKGTSLGRTLPLFGAEAEWLTDHVGGGLTSGEGVIWAVRDATTDFLPRREDGQVVEFVPVVKDPGVADKRWLVVEEEFSRLLKAKGRDGNTLSEVVRQAFDGRKLAIKSKTAPCQATGTHISVLAHITRDELTECLGRVDVFNGLANRFLWVLVRRGKLISRSTAEPDTTGLVEKVAGAVAVARQVGQVVWSADAGREWDDYYRTVLAAEPGGLFGAATARGEALSLRLALIYALLDGLGVIEVPHLRAAQACWEYCQTSAKALFGEVENTAPNTKPGAAERLALRLVKPILMKPGINRRELFKVVGNKPDKDEMNSALGLLHAHGLAQPKKAETDGRPSERWFPASDTATETPMPITPDEPLILKVAEVKIEELPVPNSMCLEPPMTAEELFETVRVRGGKLAWVNGSVQVVGLEEVSDRLRAAVAEHQDMLRSLVPAPQQEPPVPTDEEFLQRMRSLVEEPPLDLDIFPKPDSGAGVLAAK